MTTDATMIDEKALEAAEKSYRVHYEGRPMKDAIKTYLAAIKPDKGEAKETSGDSLSAAWTRYVDLFGEEPHGTVKQMAALLELRPSAKPVAEQPMPDRIVANNRCKHSVWGADHCYDCEKEAEQPKAREGKPRGISVVDEEKLRANLFDIICSHEATDGLIMDKIIKALRPYLRTAPVKVSVAECAYAIYGYNDNKTCKRDAKAVLNAIKEMGVNIDVED